MRRTDVELLVDPLLHRHGVGSQGRFQGARLHGGGFSTLWRILRHVALATGSGDVHHPTHQATGQQAHGSVLAQVFVPRTIRSEVSKRSFNQGLRQFLERAFSNGATCDAAQQARSGHTGCASAPGCKRVDVDQTHPLRERTANRTQGAPSHTDPSGERRCATRINTVLDHLVHGLAGHHGAFADGATGHAGERTHPAQGATIHPAQGDTRHRLKHRTGQQARVGEINPRRVRKPFDLRRLLLRRLALGAVLGSRLVGPLLGLEPGDLTQTFPPLGHHRAPGNGSNRDVEQAGNCARDLLESTLEVGAKVAQRRGVLFRGALIDWRGGPVRLVAVQNRVVLAVVHSHRRTPYCPWRA